MVLRAGYGIFFNHDIANARFDVARNLAGRVTLTSGNGTAGQATINWGNAIVGGGVAVIPPPYSFTMQYDHKTSNSQVYLFDIQKQLGANWMFEAGYMGTTSRHLYGFRNANYSVPYRIARSGRLLSPRIYHRDLRCRTMWRAQKHHRPDSLPELRRDSVGARHRHRPVQAPSAFR